MDTLVKIWTPWKNFQKLFWQASKSFAVTQIWKVIAILIKNMQKKLTTFNVKNLDDYHDLQVQSNTLLLAGVFQNF